MPNVLLDADAPINLVEIKRKDAFNKLREAEKAWYDYYGELEVGPDRIRAAEVYENIRNATRI